MTDHEEAHEGEWDVRSLLEVDGGPPEGSWSNALARAVEVPQDSPGPEAGDGWLGDGQAGAGNAVEPLTDLDEDSDGSDPADWSSSEMEQPAIPVEPQDWEEDSGHDQF